MLGSCSKIHYIEQEVLRHDTIYITENLFRDVLVSETIKADTIRVIRYIGKTARNTKTLQNWEEKARVIDVQEKTVNDNISSGFQLHLLRLIVLGVLIIVAVIAIRRLL